MAGEGLPVILLLIIVKVRTGAFPRLIVKVALDSGSWNVLNKPWGWQECYQVTAPTPPPRLGRGDWSGSLSLL